MSVSVFIASLPYWYYVNSGYLEFWMSYLSQIFWKYSFQNFSMSVSLFIDSLPYWYYVNNGYFQFWMSWLSQIFWRHSLDVCTLVSNNFRFLVCLSVCSLPHYLTEIRLSLDISSCRWAIFFIYVCQSIHWLTSILKLG